MMPLNSIKLQIMGVASLETLSTHFAMPATQSVYQNNCDFIMFTSFGPSEAF